MARSMDEARHELEPYLERMFRRCHEAIRDLKQLPPAAQAKFYPRTNSSIVNDLWNMGLHGELDGDPNVRIDTSHSRHRFFVLEKYQLRLKKVNRVLASSNIATQEELRFINQVPVNEQLQLFDPGEPITNLTVGYQWNRLTDELRVFVICPKGNAYEWAFEIELPDDGSGLKVVPLPGPAPQTWTQRIGRKAKKKAG